MEYIQLKPTIKDLLTMRRIAFSNSNKHNLIERLKLRAGMSPIALLTSKYTNKFYFAIDKGVIVGYVFRRFRMVRGLFIDPRYAGQGIGTKLLTIAINNNPFTVTIVKPLKSSKGFYKKYGFKKLNKKYFYYKK